MISIRKPAQGAHDPIPMFAMTSASSLEEQMEFALDTNREGFGVDLATDLGQVKVDQKMWFTDSFALSAGEWNGLTFSRTPGKHKLNDALAIEVIYSGVEHCNISGDRSVSRVSTTHMHSDCEFRDTLEDATTAGLYIPLEAVGFDPSKHTERLFHSLDTSIGALIGTALQNVVQRLPHMPSSDVPAAIEEVTDLVRDLVLASRKEVNRRNVTRARRLAIDAYIDEHIFETTLSADRLSREFAVSRASLYRMFDADGGVETYIIRRRLHRTLLALKQTASKRGAVRQVSESFGFYDAGNFTRAFKTEFGFKPSEVLGTGEIQAASLG